MAAVTTAAGPAGYSIAGRPAGPESASVADVWWSRNLTSWTRAQDMNVTTGSTQVLAVAAEPHGFVSAGSHDKRPAVWTTTDRQAVDDDRPGDADDGTGFLRRAAAGGSARGAGGGPRPGDHRGRARAVRRTVRRRRRELAAGAVQPAGPGTAITALTAYAGGFTAAGRYGVPGRQSVVTWTSASGTNWTPAPVSELGAGSGAISSLTSSGSAVTAIGSAVTAQARRFLLLALTPS